MSDSKSISSLYHSTNFERYGEIYDEKDKEKYTSLYEQVIPESKEFSIIKGKVIIINDNGAVLDLGLKSDGVLPLSELRGLNDIKVGDEIEVYFEAKEDKNGKPVISRKKAVLVKAWDTIQDAYENKKVLQGLVKRRTKGGLIVDIDGIETFLPGSQIDVSPIIDFDKFVNNFIDVVVIKIKHANDNVVVSHKALIEKEIETQKVSIINNLEKGQILEGIVKNITNFGVFVDLGGVDGLLHITDISWAKVTNPEDIFERGQKIKVVVTDFDEDKKRISLGMKQLTPHPWDTLDENVKEGSIVKGKIVNLTDYGAFLEIQKGIEGLIHVSEMSWSQYLTSPRDYVKIGDELEAKVLSINKSAKKMSLGLKQLTPFPWSDEVAGKKYIIGSIHTGIIRNITNFGAFIELEPGLEGLLHVSDISWTRKINHPSELLKVGQEIKVKVLSLDIDNKKLTLGIKQLEEDPWDTFEEIFKPGTIHTGKVIKKMARGATVELAYNIEGFVPKKGLIKKDNTEISIGDELEFIILEFKKEEHRVILSHTETFEKSQPAQTKHDTSNKKKSPQTGINLVTASKSTLGDIEELSMFKHQLIDKSKKENITATSEKEKEEVQKSKIKQNVEQKLQNEIISKDKEKQIELSNDEKKKQLSKVGNKEQNQDITKKESSIEEPKPDVTKQNDLVEEKKNDTKTTTVEKSSDEKRTKEKEKSSANKSEKNKS